MGNCCEPKKLTKEQIAEYTEHSFFVAREILALYDRWIKMGGDIETDLDSVTLSSEITELKHNLFADRLFEVFSSKRNVKLPAEQKGEDKTVHMLSFEDFVRMLTVFSARCPKNIKAYYAFLIYDFDGDTFITPDDVIKLVEHLLGEHTEGYSKQMRKADKRRIADALMKEADIDGSDSLSRNEFMRVISRLPDFAVKFQFQLDMS